MRHRALAIRLRWEIQHEGWRAGQRLPPITQLAEIHATSTSTVVRALRILVEEGLVEAVHSRGFYVLGPGGDKGLRADRPRDVVQAHVLAITSLAGSGTPIPSVAELSHTCGASIHTVYRVLLALVKKGHLRRAGQGRYVKA